MTIQEMKDRKRELGYTYEQLSERSGVPVGTIQKIFRGETSSPRYDTIMALSRALEGGTGADGIAESVIPFGGDGTRKYTVKDYEDLPPERRVELIDGMFYDMSAPAIVHQVIIREILAELRAYIRREHGPCLVLGSPVDVQLDEDDYTMVQPDVLVVCDRDKITPKRIFGAPDLIVEVLSPSTRRKDAYLKLHKYMQAGVKEYWIVDPERLVIYVYVPEHKDLVSIYHFSDAVPVAIFGGKCTVDFEGIREQISFLLD